LLVAADRAVAATNVLLDWTRCDVMLAEESAWTQGADGDAADRAWADVVGAADVWAADAEATARLAVAASPPWLDHDTLTAVLALLRLRKRGDLAPHADAVQASLLARVTRHLGLTYRVRARLWPRLARLAAGRDPALAQQDASHARSLEDLARRLGKARSQAQAADDRRTSPLLAALDAPAVPMDDDSLATPDEALTLWLS
jgi:hypothetical protein